MALDVFGGFLQASGRSTEADAVTRDDIRAFMADQVARHKPSTASNLFRALKTFFNWLEEEGHIDRTPMIGVNPPSVPETPQ